MKQYVALIDRIINEGEHRYDRTGVGTTAVFGGRLEFDLRERFPLVTIKETRWKTAFLEMLWFLRGDQDTSYLRQHGCRLWDAWANERGELGPIYGVQWRKWIAFDGEVTDQVRELIDGIKTNPAGRRHIVSAWNVGDLNQMALPPCHWAFQCYASNDGHLDMQVNQRSWDVALGAPFNIAQYALLLHLLARATGRQPRRLAFCFGDAHIYSNHLDAMWHVARRMRLDDAPTRLLINTANTDIDGYRLEDFEVTNYGHQPFVKLEIAV